MAVEKTLWPKRSGLKGFSDRGFYTTCFKRRGGF